MNWVPCSEGFNHREGSERSSLAGLAGATLRAVIVLGCEKPGAGKQYSHDVTFPRLVKRLQEPAAMVPERLGLVALDAECVAAWAHTSPGRNVCKANKPSPGVFISRHRMPHAPGSKLVGTDAVSRAAAALRSCPHPSCLQWPTQGLLCSQQGDDCPSFPPLLPLSREGALALASLSAFGFSLFR